MAKEIINMDNETGEVISITPPEVLDDAAISALVSNSINAKMSVFQSVGIETGTADTPLKALDKLETEDVTRRILHINIVHISRATSEDKGIVDKSDYPVVCFDEFPGARYSGGKRLMQLVMAWAQHFGDNFTVDDKGEKKGYVFTGDRLLPELNAYISAGNHPAVLLKEKEGANYTDVFVLGI